MDPSGLQAMVPYAVAIGDQYGWGLDMADRVDTAAGMVTGPVGWAKNGLKLGAKKLLRLAFRSGPEIVKAGKRFVREARELRNRLDKLADWLSAKFRKKAADADLCPDVPSGPKLTGLGTLGRAGKGKGVREVVGDAGDARKLFDRLRGSNPATEVKPGVLTAKGVNGGTATFRATSKSGPPTVDVHGIEEDLRKIKFVSE